MSDNKRKISDIPMEACKKSQTVLTRDYGIFTEDRIPEGMFHAGDSVFVYATTFRSYVTVHIRRYKKYANRLYPTKEGVTLQPWWIPYVLGRPEVPEAAKDLVCDDAIPTEEFKIESVDFQNFTFTRFKSSQNGECVSKSITISKTQWEQIIIQYEDISTFVSDEFYRCVDFLTAYKNEFDLPLDSNLPDSLDVSLGQNNLIDILQKSFCDSMIANGSLQEPDTRCEEIVAYRVGTFNNMSFCLDMKDVVHRFHDNLQTEQNFLLLRPHSYLTLDFLKTICMKDILQKCRNYFSPEHIGDFYEEWYGKKSLAYHTRFM